MDKKIKENSKQPEKVVFLGQQDIGKKETPKVLLVILILTILAVFWKTAVRNPDAFEVSMQKRIERNKQEEKQILERQNKQKLQSTRNKTKETDPVQPPQ